LQITLSLPSWVYSLLLPLNFYFYLPPFTLDILGWRVFTAGDWVNVSLAIGPWIVSGLESILSVVSSWLTMVYNTASGAWTLAQSAWDLAYALGAKIIQTVYQTITNVYQTLYQTFETIYWTANNIVNNVYQTLTNVYQTVNTYVVGVTEGFVQQAISAALGALADPLNLLIRFAKEIGEFFANPPGWIFDKIDNWLNEEV